MRNVTDFGCSVSRQFQRVVAALLSPPGLWCLSILSLATAAVLEVAIGPYSGKETGETALLRTRLDSF